MSLDLRNYIKVGHQLKLINGDAITIVSISDKVKGRVLGAVTERGTFISFHADGRENAKGPGSGRDIDTSPYAPKYRVVTMLELYTRYPNARVLKNFNILLDEGSELYFPAENLPYLGRPLAEVVMNSKMKVLDIFRVLDKDVKPLKAVK